MLSRRAFLTTASAALALALPRAARAQSAAANDAGARPRPTAEQLAWQRDELALFIHFGVNTFTDREWGDGTEDPSIFNPEQLDARQWARVATSAGARAMVLTAKHHDGFCLWPSNLTSHSVAKSRWRHGYGDVVREFTGACRAFGLKAGVYLSPWDRHEPSYGDTDRYNDFYCGQLTELLTQYGRIDEVWFDGANGEGPNGRKQTYDWPRIWALVRRLQPHAVMFSDAGPDVRWVGNENGVAADTNWSTVDPAAVPAPGTSGAAAMKMLREGDPRGRVWRPGETDVSIRPGWFHHPAENARVRSVDDLAGLFFTSVGRNSKLLLNVPPARSGLIDDVDAERLRGMRARLDDIFRTNVAAGRKVRWSSSGSAPTGIVDLGRRVTASIADLGEDIARGQSVARYQLDASIDGRAWEPLANGTTIGYRKLDRFAPVELRYARLTVTESVAPPAPIAIALYAPAKKTVTAS